jgi:hypothetical protein
MKNTLLRDAIADAKLVKKLAIDQARERLNEELTGKVRKIVSKNLNEDEDLDSELNKDDLDEAFEPDEDDNLDENLNEDDNLDENLNEGDEPDEDNLDEDLDTTDDDEDDLDDLDGTFDDENDKLDEGTEPDADDDITEGEDHTEPDADDIDEALLPEDEDFSDLNIPDEDETKDDTDIMAELDALDQDNDGDVDDVDSTLVPESSDGTGDVTAAAGDTEPDADDLKSKLEAVDKQLQATVKENIKLKKALKIHENAVTYLKKEYAKVNLFNSKLYYTTKVLKAIGLDEAQKRNVIAMYDRANSLREVRLIHDTVVKTLNKIKTKNLSKIAESAGSSRSVKVVNGKKREVIFEDKNLNRMNQLAFNGKK